MLLAEIAKALKQAFGARQRNAEGDYRPDPMAERFPSEEFQRRGLDAAAADEGGSRRSRSSSSPPLSPGKVSLMGLVEDWWRETKAGGMSLSTYESYRNTARKFGQFLKHDDAARVSAEESSDTRTCGLPTGSTIGQSRPRTLQGCEWCSDGPCPIGG
jgi:hypothetical protein